MFSTGRMRNCLMLACAAVCLIAYAPDAIAGGGVQAAGVVIGPDGVLRSKIFIDATGKLTRQRLAEARAKLTMDLVRPSRLRKISLNRLEAAVAEQMKAGRFETDEMKYLAGLTRITHVFFYPETKDIVIAGPAEGFVENVAGRVVGIDSGKAILQLQDLVTALRAYPPTGDPTSVISVSIDPTQEGLQRMQQFLVRLGGRAVPGDTRRIVQGLKSSLGLQKVTIKGVSPQTHFATVLVEADYRMKMIGIGLEKPAADITTYVERANPRDVARNALQRWFFVPNYECVKVSADSLAMELVDSTVKLIGQDEMVNADGSRVATGKVDRAGKAFTTSFTKNYDKMAERSPVYGEMRNLIDMAVAAAFIRREDYYSQAGWTMELFGNEDQFQVETYTVPKHVETAVNARWKGRTLMTPVGGGVQIQARQALQSDRLLKDEDGKLDATRAKISLDQLKVGQWWWD